LFAQGNADFKSESDLIECQPAPSYCSGLLQRCHARKHDQKEKIMSADITKRLSDELKNIASDAEDLVKVQGEQLAEKTKQIRDRLAETLQAAQETLDSLETRAQASVKAADQAIRTHPYQSIGIALAVGVALGLLIRPKQ
jgi:ElaB/YqjD/DUF883 family membrane-anchored ribosome-binding protein